MANYSIRDLERLSGIKAHTIRIWEKRYNIIQPKRTSTNIRLYCDSELKKLLNVSILTRNGFRISQVATLSPEELKEKVVFLIHESEDYHNQIDHLVVAMLEFNEHKFEKIITDCIIKTGFEHTMTRIVYPFFEKIGILWQTGTIQPAHEHFVSNLIRQKLIVAIDGQTNNPLQNPAHFLLFLPEGELHELGLLFYAYLIKKKGHQLIYLGQNVPFQDVVEAAKINRSDYLFTQFSSPLTEKELQDYVKEMKKQFPDSTLLITGFQTRNIKNLPDNVIHISSPQDFYTYIK